MNFRKIIDKVREDGGCSYSPTYGHLTKAGYGVSPYKDREEQILFSELTENDIKNYYNENVDLLVLPNHYLGVWVDNGVAYLDVSVFEPNKKKALSIAANSSQLAIYDIGNQKTVFV